ncbi:Crotonobetainyl-CoA:carnitine CoA-transferase CaiB [Fodinibius salinus]|uniref:Crotonobetainyl-CoA:carnitine CoA-transferase CaiB n=1 Tax=Fodinibius salinus TaxID=860790 RepID=A0A5D3YP29_9BACT|nr:CoA transferase [Fodinibius salinus]TYP94779.1 Crotonobetainyl-CoA:carnitine CoA-transferase CaiB [Fodinibius salinus]
MQSLFSDLTIVELASVLAGPAVGNFFSELGAEVIKVENKTNGGDVTRQWRQPNETTEGPSAYYSSVNWNKESVLLDFTDDTDMQKVRQLLRDADIVITNFKKGDDKKFDLTYEDLKTLKPSVIHGKISGFGSDSDRPAYDLILQAETGFMSMNGQPKSPPTKMPLALIDLLAAHQLKEGILCALLKQKENPNQPFNIEVSLYESAISSLINQATNWLMNGNIPQQIGSKHPNIAPYGEIFTTIDDYSITFGIGSDRQFRDLCNILDAETLAEDPKYESNEGRVEHRQELAAILRNKIEQLKGVPLLKKCRSELVPAAEIKNVQQVFEGQKAHKMLLRETIEGRETVRPQTTVFNIRS